MAVLKIKDAEGNWQTVQTLLGNAGGGSVEGALSASGGVFTGQTPFYDGENSVKGSVFATDDTESGLLLKAGELATPAAMTAGSMLMLEPESSMLGTSTDTGEAGVVAADGIAGMYVMSEAGYASITIDPEDGLLFNGEKPWVQANGFRGGLAGYEAFQELAEEDEGIVNIKSPDAIVQEGGPLVVTSLRPMFEGEDEILFISCSTKVVFWMPDSVENAYIQLAFDAFEPGFESQYWTIEGDTEVEVGSIYMVVIQYFSLYGYMKIVKLNVPPQ